MPSTGILPSEASVAASVMKPEPVTPAELRAEWDIAKYLRSGRLQIVLEDYASPPADIYAVYPEKHKLSSKVKVFTEFLAASFDDPNQKSKGAVKW